MAGRPSDRRKAGKLPGQRAKEQREELMRDLEEADKANGGGNPITELYRLRKEAYVQRLKEAAAEHREAETLGPETKAAVMQCIAMVGEGYSIREAAHALGYNYPRINIAVYRDEALKAALDGAREQYAHERVRLMGQLIEAEPDPVRARLIADCIKWEVSKVLPRFYGEKVAVEAPDGISFSLNIGKKKGKESQ